MRPHLVEAGGELVIRTGFNKKLETTERYTMQNAIELAQWWALVNLETYSQKHSL